MAVTKFVLNETSYFGEGARSVLADEIKNRGFKKVLVVTDKSLYEVGVSKKVTNILDEAGIEYGVYHDCLLYTSKRCRRCKKSRIYAK